MNKLYPKIYEDQFKLRIKVFRDDAGKRTLSINLRPKFGKLPRFYYFNNSRTSNFTLIPQEGKEQAKFYRENKRMSLKEARYLTLQYLLNYYKSL